MRRRELLPVETPHPRVQRELLEAELELLVVDLLPQGEAQAHRKPLLGADAERSGARGAIPVEEVDRLAAQHRDVLLAGNLHRRLKARRIDRDAGRGDLLVAGQLVQETSEHHRLGVLEGQRDLFPTRVEKLRPVGRRGGELAQA